MQRYGCTESIAADANKVWGVGLQFQSSSTAVLAQFYSSAIGTASSGQC